MVPFGASTTWYFSPLDNARPRIECDRTSASEIAASQAKGSAALDQDKVQQALALLQEALQIIRTLNMHAQDRLMDLSGLDGAILYYGQETQRKNLT